MALADDPVVVDGEIIFANWHNSQRNHAIRVAADVAALGAIDGLTDGMIGWASTTGQLYHRRAGVWVPISSAIKISALPATIPIPSAVNTITVTGRLFSGGTAQTIPDALGARFNGLTTMSYYRVLETVSNAAAFVRDFANGNFARLGPVPINTNSNMSLSAIIDAAHGAWQSTGFAIRTATIWQQDRVAGGLVSPQRITSLELLVPSPSGTPTNVALSVSFS